MKEKIFEIVEKIKELEIEVMELAEKKEDFQKVQSEIENGYKAEIENAVDENGKPLYSNALKREVALNKKLSDDPKWEKKGDKIKGFQRELGLKRIDLSYEHNMFRAYEIISKMGE